MSGGFGIGPYGTSPYGTGAYSLLGSGFFIVSAVLIEAVTLRVILSQPYDLVSASSPLSWIVRDETLDYRFEVYGVSFIDSTTVDLHLATAPTPSVHTYSVGGTVLSSTGDALNPPTAPFIGIDLASLITNVGKQQKRDFDFSNPFLDANAPPSTLRIGSSGDYEMSTGRDLILKLIIRRLTSFPGEFLFLPDSYGVGLLVNAPLFVADLARLRKQIQQGLEREPEIAAVSVQITMGADGMLSVSVRGLIRKTGAPFAIDVPVQSNVSFT